MADTAEWYRYNTNQKYFKAFWSWTEIKSTIAVQISENRAREWCVSKGNIPYFETSAKENYNIEEAFLCAAEISLANEHQPDM